MNYYNYQDELKALLELIEFKQYHRYGQTLYARYETMKPEITLCELAWGFCRNPCFANKLYGDLNNIVPDRTKFSSLMSKSNRAIESELLNPSFDYAMRQICSKISSVMLAYSTESTNMRDRTEIEVNGSATQYLHASDEDGELWHGLLIENQTDWNKIDSIKIALQLNDDVVWQHTFNRREVAKHIKAVNDVCMWVPFKHPVIMFNVGLEVLTQINFDGEPEQEVKQVFGVGSNEFCVWLSETSFETKLCKDNYLLIDMPARRVNLRINLDL